MAPIKITGVVSCSSEDKVSCAKNLLLSDSFKKWATEKPGVSTASVILQLEAEQQITGIDIGNNGSAFVEVLVANSANDSEYENLIVMSSFMTPSESRSQTNRYKIRMFAKEELCKQTADKKWDRLKVVCTQPYNKNTAYGLSVVTVQGVNRPLPKVAAAPLQVLEPVGKETSSAKSSAISSNSEKSPAVKKQKVLEFGGSKEGKAASDLLSKLQQNKASSSREALDRLKESGDKGFKRVPGSILDIRDDEDDSKPSSSDKSKTPVSKSKISTPGTPKRDVSEVLSEVVFVLSGFQNPLRSDIREIGLSMGAQYRPDWCSEATHLICAIPNTPKFNQVKGKGIIVGKEWLFDCKKEKKRVSESKYRLDKPSKSSSEDETSDKEEDATKSTQGRNSPPTKRKQSKKIQYVESSDSDSASEPPLKKRKPNDESDEEFVPTEIISSSDEEEEDSVEPEETANKSDKKSEKTSKPLLEISSDEDVPLNPVSKPPLPDISDSESEAEETAVYEADTDEETESDVVRRLGLPPLPDFFTGHRFFIHADSFEEAEDVRQMYRYLVAYGGKVFDHMSPEVAFVVTKSDSWLSDFKQALFVNAKIKFLRSAWVTASSDQLKAVSKSSYYIDQ